ncbi:hypothetical protein [Ferruginibacter profundus]
MALDEFEREQLSERDKNIIRMRSITNYTMGVFFIAVGFFFMFPTKYTIGFLSKYDPSTMKMFAVICWVYGLFRLFRGYSKNYFKDR